MKFDKKALVKYLYEIKDYAHKIPKAIKETLKDKRALEAAIGGCIVYGIPAGYRFVTGNPHLPYIPENKPFSLLSLYIPHNLVEN